MGGTSWSLLLKRGLPSTCHYFMNPGQAWYNARIRKRGQSLQSPFSDSRTRRMVMLPTVPTPLIRLGNLFPQKPVYAKCEFLAPSGSFKIRGALHLLDHLSRESQTRQLVVPSMSNTA